MSLISVNEVTKRFAANVALNQVSLTIKAGTIVLLQGPNGSGKTTLLRLLAQLDAPSSGSIEATKKNFQFSVLFEQRHLYRQLTVAENLDLFANLIGCSCKDRDIAMERFGLNSLKDRFVGTLSRGEAQRVGLARTFLCNADLFLLDEPCAPLDEEYRHVFLAEIEARRNSGSAIVIASHSDEKLQALADKTYHLNDGILQ